MSCKLTDGTLLIIFCLNFTPAITFISQQAQRILSYIPGQSLSCSKKIHDIWMDYGLSGESGDQLYLTIAHKITNFSLIFVHVYIC